MKETSNGDAQTTEQPEGATQASGGLLLLERFFGFAGRQIDQLPTGKRAGTSEFLKFVGVWIGLAITLSAGIAARAAEHDTRIAAIELYYSFPIIAWILLSLVLSISFIVSGLIAHSHHKVTYGYCIWVGIKWGSGIIFVFAVAPVIWAILRMLESLAS